MSCVERIVCLGDLIGRMIGLQNKHQFITNSITQISDDYDYSVTMTGSISSEGGITGCSFTR